MALKCIPYLKKKSLPENLKLLEIVCSSRVGLQVIGWLCHIDKSIEKGGGSSGLWVLWGFLSCLVIDSRLLSWMMISGVSMLEYLKGPFKLLWENY